MVPHGDVDQVMNSGATALLRKRELANSAEHHNIVEIRWSSSIKPPGSKYGFISCMSTQGWWIARLEMGNIGGQARGSGTRNTTTS